MTKRKTIRTLLFVLYAAIIAGMILAVDWTGAAQAKSFLLRLGRVAGLMAFVILVFQAVLTCRLKILDRIFAIDNITNFHKRMGMIVAGLLLLHVTLLILGTGHTGLLSLDTSWRVNLGKAALALALVTVILAASFQAFGLDYNIWRISHKSALAIVALGFLHSFFIGSDLQTVPMRVIWWILLASAAAAAAYRNLVIPLWKRRRYQIKAVDRQVHNVYTLTLTAEDKAIPSHKPGQFIFLKLRRPGRKSEIHPFTLSSCPLDTSVLQVTIKQSGNFTDTIDRTKTTDMAYVEGPYGQFSFLNEPPRPILFLAGGVGITPIMSMIRCLRDAGDTRKTVLLYGSRTAEDIIFRDELEKLPENFGVLHVLSKADQDWTGLKGVITKDLIREQAGPMLDQAEVFLCGPPVMMNKVIGSLKKLEIPKNRIHYERFTI